MTKPVPDKERLDRKARIRSVPCPRCGAGKGHPCKGPSGLSAQVHHGARYDALYRTAGSR